MSQHPRDPFAPIEAAVIIVLAFIGLTFGGFAGLAAYDAVANDDHIDVTLFEFHSPACASVADGIGVSEPSDLTLRPGGSVVEESFNVCVRHPSWAQQLAASADGLASMVFLIGSGVLILRAIRRARRDGLFTIAVAHSLRLLGWFLLAMSLLVPICRALGSGVIVAAAIEGQEWWGQLGGALPSFIVLLVGLGVITFARIMRLTVPLQEEVTLTV